MKKKLRGMDVDDFLILDYIESGISVTETAKLLNVTQPAVSQRLAKIKDIVGFPIIFHIKRGIKLTEKGRRLSLAARQSLELIVSAFPDSLSDGRG